MYEKNFVIITSSTTEKIDISLFICDEIEMANILAKSDKNVVINSTQYNSLTIRQFFVNHLFPKEYSFLMNRFSDDICNFNEYPDTYFSFQLRKLPANINLNQPLSDFCDYSDDKIYSINMRQVNSQRIINDDSQISIRELLGVNNNRPSKLQKNTDFFNAENNSALDISEGKEPFQEADSSSHCNIL